jgi:hypothetical protein
MGRLISDEVKQERLEVDNSKHRLPLEARITRYEYKNIVERNKEEIEVQKMREFIPGKFYNVNDVINDDLIDLKIIHKIKDVDYHMFRRKEDDGNRYYFMHVPNNMYWLKEIRRKGDLK